MDNLQEIKEIFYRLAKDQDLKKEDLRELAQSGYIAAQELNRELKEIYKTIGNLTLD